MRCAVGEGLRCAGLRKTSMAVPVGAWRPQRSSAAFRGYRHESAALEALAGAAALRGSMGFGHSSASTPTLVRLENQQILLEIQSSFRLLTTGDKINVNGRSWRR